MTELFVPDPNAFYNIHLKHNDKVLDYNNLSGVAISAQVIQYTRRGGPLQMWSFVPVGGGWYQIRNRNAGLVLHCNGSMMDYVTLFGSIPGAPVQQWRIIPSDAAGYFHLEHRAHGNVLDVFANLEENMAPIFVFGKGAAFKPGVQSQYCYFRLVQETNQEGHPGGGVNLDSPGPGPFVVGK